MYPIVLVKFTILQSMMPIGTDLPGEMMRALSKRKEKKPQGKKKRKNIP